MSDGTEPVDPLISGRELVTRLAELGVGRWTPAAVRQWIREEPPCPVAAPSGGNGQPNRYRLRPVMAWLKARAERERAKGFTRADGLDQAKLVDLALSILDGAPPAAPEAATTPVPAVACGQVQLGILDANTAPTSGAGAAEPRDLSPAKREHIAWDQLTDAEAMLRILQGTGDPRNWEAAERALTTRQNRLREARELIPLAELSLALEANVTDTLSTIQATRPALKTALRDLVRAEHHGEVDRLVDEAFAGMLKRLANPNTEADADSSAQLETEQ